MNVIPLFLCVYRCSESQAARVAMHLKQNSVMDSKRRFQQKVRFIWKAVGHFQRNQERKFDLFRRHFCKIQNLILDFRSCYYTRQLNAALHSML